MVPRCLKDDPRLRRRDALEPLLRPSDKQHDDMALEDSQLPRECAPDAAVDDPTLDEVRRLREYCEGRFEYLDALLRERINEFRQDRVDNNDRVDEEQREVTDKLQQMSMCIQNAVEVRLIGMRAAELDGSIDAAPLRHGA